MLIYALTLHIAQAFENLTDEEWHYTYDFCMQNNVNACNYLIDNGLLDPQSCTDNQCKTIGMIHTLAGRYDEALAYFYKVMQQW